MKTVKACALALAIQAVSPATRAQTLQITRQGETISVCWPVVPGCTVLQSSASLGPDADWQFDPATPAGGGPGQCVTVAATDHARFYRLIHPGGPPTAPTNARYRADSELLSLDWDLVPEATSYNFYVGLTPQVGPGSSLMRLLELPNTLATVGSLSPGQRYYLVATAVNCLGEGPPSTPVEAVFGPRGSVNGSLFTRVGQGADQLVIPPAGVGSYLENVDDGSRIGVGPTDGFGGFNFGGVPAGHWRPCWDGAGYVPGCGESFELTGDGAFLPPLEILPLSGGSGLVFGRVTFADGSVPRGGDSFFDVWVDVDVSLSDPGGTELASTPLNSDGEYVLAGVPRAAGLKLRARLGTAEVEQVIDTLVIGRADLVLPNRPPAISGLKALMNGNPVIHAEEGDLLELVAEATDPDGDPLQFRWLDGDTEAGPVIAEGPSHATWRVPQPAAQHLVYVRVTDGKGGFATARLALDGTGETLFTGVVVGSDGPVLPGATVRVNETFQATTDSDGWFSLRVADRRGPFVLDISRPGYALYSEYNTTGETGGQYPLSKLSAAECNLAPTSEIHVNGPSGADLVLPANSLLMEAGAPITSPVCVSVTPLDPCSLEGPNFFREYLGTVPAASPLYFFGMVFADARPESGPPLGVGLANRATVMIPLRSECLAAAGFVSPPDKLRLWRLYRPGASWERVDDAQRVDLGGGQFAYVGTVPVLGLLAVGGNSDEKMVPLEITLDKSLNAAIEIRVVKGTEVLKRHVFDNDVESNTGEDAIKLRYPVPPAKDLKIQVIHLKEAPGAYFGDVNDAASKRKEEEKTVILERPIDASKLDPAKTHEVILSLDQTIKGLALDRISKPDHFLTFESRQAQILGIKVNAFDESDGYYQAIEGSAGLQPNFDTFLRRNGFMDTGKFAAYASATYFNACDLGFGRAMFAMAKEVEVKVSVPGPDDKPKIETRKHKNVAYFVTNFDTVENAVGAKVPANVRGDPGTIATVAMEYSYGPFDDKGVALLPRPYTKFYVFNAVGNRANFADLDRHGNKPIPNLCINCHGGRPVVPYSKVRGTAKLGYLDRFERPDKDKPAVYKGEAFLGDVEANFIPFDATSFTYPAKGVPLAEFRKLNDLILDTKPTAAVAAAVAGWRGAGAQFVIDYTPPNWAAQKTLYTDVFGISCRSCHITRKPALQFPSFDTFSKRAVNIEGLVCRRQLMPNAQRTYGVFWGTLSAQKYPNKFQVKNQPDLLGKALTDADFADCPKLR